MSDRELLELAARAAGVPGAWIENCPEDGCPTYSCGIGSRGRITALWNPLTNDGDAMRLAVKLKIMHASFGDGTEACFDDQKGGEGYVWQGFGEDGSLSEYEAARRAIVRAAAEIGKAKGLAEKKTFDNYCTCGGYAHTMNGRPVEQPHMSWCPQAKEYAEWFAAQGRKAGGGK